MQTKSLPLTELKAGAPDGLEDGTFEALISSFNTVDSYGDVVIPGAFAKTLTEWAERGDSIPVVWSHKYDDPEYHIGVVESAEEREDGLWVKGRLDLDQDAVKARQVYRLLKGRRVTQFSFSYDTIDSAMAQRDGQDVRELREVKLYEVGPTLIGANQNTELGEVKSLLQEAKAGRVLSGKNEEKLRELRKTLGGIVADLDDLLSEAVADSSTSDDGKATASTVNADEEPTEAKSAGPATASPASLRLRLDLAALMGEVPTLTTI